MSSLSTVKKLAFLATNYKEMVEKYPEEMFERCIHGMVPKGRLGRQIEKKLFVYKGADHKHEAQKPEVLEFKF